MNYSDLGFNSLMQRTIISPYTNYAQDVRNDISTLNLMLNPVTNIVFSSTDFDTAAWAAGTIYFADGSTSGLIAAGNTGNMAATTYVYYDRNKPGILLTTTTYSSSIGATKVLVAIAQLGTSGSGCIIDVLNSNSSTIDGDRVVTGKIQSSDGKTYFDLDNDKFVMNDGSFDRLFIGNSA